ncbi:aldo/keto reductase [Thiohalorhabdus denitrificans]|uniref:Aldo/keto reductase n=1 Tax=Thiohalorhabdus denitrificans TaxID=381306 RepID=A0A1G5AJV3_9GAMM|nr:aldo/keto reductase [Thiohalorhabdus denitrificans]SCX78100.1 Aldo/keto reductase [Thiohalorhabdus denitrificans]
MTSTIPGMSRRAVLKLMAAAGGLAVTGVPSVAAREAMRSRAIPSSGEEVPVVGLGTARTFNLDPGEEREPLRGVLREFFAAGGRVIDTSPMYGTAETVIGDLLGDMDHPEVFYATKVWTRGEEAGIRQMEESAERMGTDVIDLIQVHNLVDWRTQLKTLRRWKDEGRIRYLGITHYRVSAFDDLERIMREEGLDWVQLPLSLATPDAADRLLPLAADRGIAVLVNRPFENGGLFRAVRGRELPEWAGEIGAESWAQLFLKYILGHPEVTCVIPATSDPEHAADNMRAGMGPLPDAGQRRRMRELWESLV